MKTNESNMKSLGKGDLQGLGKILDHLKENIEGVDERQEAEIIKNSEKVKLPKLKNKIKEPYTPSQNYEDRRKKKEFEQSKNINNRIKGLITATYNHMEHKNDRVTRESGEIKKTREINKSREKVTTMSQIVELFKNNKIDEVIVASEKTNIPGKKETVQGLKPDLDAYMALYLLNEYNKKPLNEVYNENSKTTVKKKNGEEINGGKKELLDQIKTYGEEEKDETSSKLIVYVDTGGEWLKIKKDGVVSTVYIDHHGHGTKQATSGTKMMLEIMRKADMLKELPPWMTKLINFTNDIDNLSYIGKKDRNKQRTFNESYLRNEWPNSLYALAEKQIPFETLIEMFKSGLIKDPTKPFTEKELAGDIGNFMVGEISIRDLCKQKMAEVSDCLENGISKAIKQNKTIDIKLETTELGKIIYHNFFKEKGIKNTIPNHLAMKATIAKGYDSFVSWSKKNNEFYINAIDSKSLVDIAKRLNEKFPGCANEIRGKFIFGKINEMTEEEFLEIVGLKTINNEEKEKREALLKQKEIEQKREDLYTRIEEYRKNLKTYNEEKVRLNTRLEKLNVILEVSKRKDEEEYLNTLEKETKAEEKEKQIKEKFAEIESMMDGKQPVPEVKGEETKDQGSTVSLENGVKTYSLKFIKDKINGLLLGVKEISEIKSLEITGSGDQIKIETAIVSYGFNIKVQLLLENSGDSIEVKDYTVDAKWPAKGKAEKALAPHIDKISQMLKSYIEKEEGIEIEKIWIEEGVLRSKAKNEKTPELDNTEEEIKFEEDTATEKNSSKKEGEIEVAGDNQEVIVLDELKQIKIEEIINENVTPLEKEELQKEFPGQNIEEIIENQVVEQMNDKTVETAEEREEDNLLKKLGRKIKNNFLVILISASTFQASSFTKTSESDVLSFNNTKIENLSDWEKVKLHEDEINKMENISIITKAHENSDDKFIIIDKQNGKAHRYQGDSLIKSYNVCLGDSIGDEQTVLKSIYKKVIIDRGDEYYALPVPMDEATYVENGERYLKDGYEAFTEWGDGNMKTGAGIYKISNKGPFLDDFGLFLKNERGVQVATSLHVNSHLKSYAPDFRFTNGCVGFSKEDLLEIYKTMSIDENVYILSDNPKNKYQMVDGKLRFLSNQQNVNRTIRPYESRPITIEAKKSTETASILLKTISENKEKLMKLYPTVSNDVYNELAKITYGILGQESSFGTYGGARGQFGRIKDIGASIAGLNPSVGPCQVRLENVDPKIQKAFNINKNDDLFETKTNAIAAMSVLLDNYLYVTNNNKDDNYKELVVLKYNAALEAKRVIKENKKLEQLGPKAKSYIKKVLNYAKLANVYETNVNENYFNPSWNYTSPNELVANNNQ